MTVSEMLGRMDSTELAEWMAYDRIEPFGDQRADLRSAILCQQILAPYLKEGAKLPDLKRFMPFVEQEPEEEQGLTGDVGAQVARQMFGEK